MEIEDLEKAQVDNTHAVSFGLPKLDAFLNDGNSEGGLLKGDMTVLLAPSKRRQDLDDGDGCGRQHPALVTMCFGSRTKARVSDLKVKMWEALMEETRPSLFKNMYQPQFRAALEMCKEKMRKHLIFMPLNKAGLTVEDGRGCYSSPAGPVAIGAHGEGVRPHRGRLRGQAHDDSGAGRQLRPPSHSRDRVQLLLPDRLGT